jgi:hypothetical protein
MAAIPNLIRKEREQVTTLAGRIANSQKPVSPRWEAKQSSLQRQVGRLAHNELLFSWLVETVWRQRNIRELKLGSNLFRAEIQPMASMAIPQWVRERTSLNPHEEFWQVHFRENDTKMKHEGPLHPATPLGAFAGGISGAL